ncbi:MAG: RagB/SusD family nutrient uptake outer membrane protein [Gemmatimonadetes bacterium]|nr:RagB/SusD family nutrient uptake outer membrane protein [Gemmatimonadota bacterium]
MKTTTLSARLMAGLILASSTTACSGLLDVEFPGRIPEGALNDPALANVLVTGVIGDLECAYNNYMSGSAVHSDEYESSNSNVPLANYGERGIGPDEDDYVVSGCEAGFGGAFGMHQTLQTARFQAEDVFAKLNAWTDAQVANRRSLMATARAYGGYAALFMGETFCSVAFDGGAQSPPSAGLQRAEAAFTEAITLAQAAGDNDILNMARVGLARSKVGLKKWAEAATAAAQVPAGYEKFADRGTENDRRWNKLFFFATSLGAYVVSSQYRVLAQTDPRIGVVNTGRPAFNPFTVLWIATKPASLGTPQRLASFIEARLLQAEALIQQNQIAQGIALLNVRRDALGLTRYQVGTQAAAIQAVIAERRAELSFEGGHRLNDLLRYSLPWKGANGSTTTVNEFTLRPYGATTCWPFPTKEANGA